MINVSDLTKSYGAVQALRGVSFSIAQGEIIGLLGPNGAGKTTIMKILTGYLQPSGGSVQVAGMNVVDYALEVQKHIGYLPENAPLYPELSVQAYLQMIADLREIGTEEQLACLSEAIRATGLEDHLTRPIGHLSKGFRQRVGLAQAILHNPQILILDEPTIGLDPTQIVEIRLLIRRLSQQSTILLSTHILSEVEALCDRVIILLNGEVKADARLEDLSSTSNVILQLASDTKDVPPELTRLPGVSTVTSSSKGGTQTLSIGSLSGSDLRPAIFALARDLDWPLIELRRDTQTLESVFNHLATSVGEGTS